MKLSELYAELTQAHEWAQKIDRDPEIKIPVAVLGIRATVKEVTFEMTPKGAVILKLTFPAGE